jgi:hypothetical protein
LHVDHERKFKLIALVRIIIEVVMLIIGGH